MSSSQSPAFTELDLISTEIQGLFVEVIGSGTTGYTVSTIDTPSITFKSIYNESVYWKSMYLKF